MSRRTEGALAPCSAVIDRTSAVIARLDRAIQYPETAVLESRGCGVLDRPPSRTMTPESTAPPSSTPQDTHRRSRGALRPSFANIHPLTDRGRRECRELAAPMARLQKEKQAAVTTGSAETSRHSPRDGFNVYTYSPWCAGLLATIPRVMRGIITALTPASGCQDDTTSRPPRAPYV